MTRLARACDLYASATRLWEMYKTNLIVEHRVRGEEVNPCYRAALQGFADARKIFVTFGIGPPAERSRLKVPEPVKQKSKFGMVP